MQIKNRLAKIYLQTIKGLSLPGDLIKYAVKRNSDKIAIIDGEREITYGELYERAKKLANAILDLGLAKGDKLAVLLYNSQEYFEIRIAAYLTGIVLVPIVWDMELEDIIFILNDCHVKALIYHPEILKDNIGKVKEKTCVKNFISVPSRLPLRAPTCRGEAIPEEEIASSPLTSKMSRAPRNDGMEQRPGNDEDWRQPRNGMDYEELLSQGASVEPDIELKETDLASINFSSGTTGRPKGIMLLQKSWVNSFYNYVLNSPKAKIGERIILHLLSLATAGGTSFLPALFLGMRNIVIDKPDVEKAVALILKHKVNSLFASPGIFINLFEYCKKESIKLPLDGIVIGTEQMPGAKFREAIECLGSIIQRGYGMAEVLPPLTLLCSRDYMENNKLKEARLLCVGRVLKGVSVKIRDEEEKVLPSGKIGKIALKSASVSNGYWNNPELTKQHYKNGWFYSNDYGYLDGEGFLYVLGRKEDIVHIRGQGTGDRGQGGKIEGATKDERTKGRKDENFDIIFTQEIEETLHKHPGILEVCVFKTKEDKIVASVSLRTSAKDVSSEELIRFCQDKLEKDIIPGIIKIFPQLPKNASGKLDRRKIRAELEI